MLDAGGGDGAGSQPRSSSREVRASCGPHQHDQARCVGIGAVDLSVTFAGSASDGNWLCLFSLVLGPSC